jgi:general secretion pathway protein C
MNSRQVRLGIDLFTGLVVASVGVALAGLSWRLFGTSTPPVVATTAGTTANPVDIGGLLALAPFGTAIAASDTASDGSLHLKGILMAIPASGSSALIAGSDGKVTSYGIGAALGGGVVEAINADQVILRTPRGLQTVGFTPVVTGTPLLAVGTANKGTGFVPLGAAAKFAPAGPVAPAGFQIGSSAPAALFAAGLQTGDVIQQVNGAPVTAGMSADMVSQVLASAALHGGSAQVLVLRKGNQVSLRLAMH